MKTLSKSLQQELKKNVKYAIAEDIGSGDITAALIPKTKRAKARVFVRHEAVLSGGPWFNAVYDSLDRSINVIWYAKDGDAITKDQIVCELVGPAASILTGERTALNFLQTLSATATATRDFSTAMIDSNTKILDTRKTIPGLRLAQKYAVRCGGGHNHRLGLYDAILIKENHIAASGSISKAVQTIRISNQAIKIEVEVESLGELKEALDNNVDMVLLDNFSVSQIKEAVKLVNKKALIELSGGITLNDVTALKSLGVDYISVGALTKDIRATDFSMLFGAVE